MPADSKMKTQAMNSEELQIAGRKRRPGRPSLSDAELLDRALDLFLRLGFEGTSIEAITSAAGMAKRTVYTRYGDKRGLFQAALQRAIEQWIVPPDELCAAETDDLEETLRNISHLLMSNIMTPAGLRLLRITNAESSRMPEIGAYTYRNGTERTIDYLADLFQRRLGGQPEAHWREAALAFLNSVVSGPPTQTAWGVSFDDEHLERHITFSVRLFIYGLLPRSADGSEELNSASKDEATVRELQKENELLRQLLVNEILEKAGREQSGDALKAISAR